MAASDNPGGPVRPKASEDAAGCDSQGGQRDRQSRHRCRPRQRQLRRQRADSGAERLLQPAVAEAAHLDLGSPALFFFRRHCRRLVGDRVRRPSVSRRSAHGARCALDRHGGHGSVPRASDFRSRQAARASSTCCAYSNGARRCPWVRGFFPVSAAPRFSRSLQTNSFCTGFKPVPSAACNGSANLPARSTGLLLASYTGVLLGATAIPVWHENRRLLPAHFLTSGLGGASAILEFFGFLVPATQVLGFAAPAIETLIGIMLELRHGRVDAPLHHGKSGWTMRIAGALEGPGRVVRPHLLAWLRARPLRCSCMLPPRRAVQPLRLDLGRARLGPRSASRVRIAARSYERKKRRAKDSLRFALHQVDFSLEARFAVLTSHSHRIFRAAARNGTRISCAHRARSIASSELVRGAPRPAARIARNPRKASVHRAP